jgi:glutathione S-transferase
MTGKIVFYTNPRSRGAIVHWMLEETGMPYETKVLDFGTTMKEAAYLEINPMGKVPAIVRGDTVVTECAAICAWLADAYPEAGLAPPPGERADYYRWMFFAAGPLEAAVTNKALGVAVDEKQRGFVGYGVGLEPVLDALESAIAANPWIAGERFSAADVYVGSQIGWGLMFGTIERRPAFEAYWARLTARPANARAKTAG